ncbi:uncharacterized protein LOC113342539 [Papaver somniferum]|uniref:uncharacterized protein LOC113342539 n=1 Tax=Papaver somniferum TaxID=3469 RepID=UPI000E6F6873|nr:uncharacterized protein LOC113342539 [Papaver somniferum]
MEVDEHQGNPQNILRERNSKRWEILFDGSVNGDGNGIGIVIISPLGARMEYSFRLEFASTNNKTEYEGVIHVLRLVFEMDLDNVRITSDSQLVIRHILGIYSVNKPSLQKYKLLPEELSAKIKNIEWRHISRKDNRFADALEFLTSMLKDPTARHLNITTLCFPSIKKEEEAAVMMIEGEEGDNNVDEEDWRSQLH